MMLQLEIELGDFEVPPINLTKYSHELPMIPNSHSHTKLVATQTNYSA